MELRLQASWKTPEGRITDAFESYYIGGGERLQEVDVTQKQISRSIYNQTVNLQPPVWGARE